VSTFRHYLNLHHCESRLRRLLQDFEFAPVSSVLKTLSMPTVSTVSIFASA
ncbi:MAG TPA: DUF3473 domain-containing protein, partial [Candidatus Competibacteraceae bacterium]|nr:DUF3473 domain-containing protein [Candidatus Competibacteraceae bacterium]